ncbi:hypothetical protein AN618_13300 [Fervidicola ferrireducens]|uniref:Outer membrane efflux protein n=1 Tax=Fervidicola ferrireducens TaxID=520764 RepID=A0A140L8S9_9FIRM|nr:TolC family protein [Fervidicola ferrireducens]KXG76954.1 hypothetical protein AN618_13300 [Fervidicola ferrireducens]
MKTRKCIQRILAFIALTIFTIVGTSAKASTLQPPDEKLEKLSLLKCIEMALKNNINLKLVQDELDMAKLQEEKADFMSRKLGSGEDTISEGKEQLSEAKEQLSEVEKELEDPNLPPEKRAYLEGMKKQLESAITEGEALLEKGEELLDKSLDQIIAGLNNVKSAQDLINIKAGVTLDVASTARSLADRQIALLVQKQYYDVLKAQKILEVKQKALERAEGQLNIAQAGYNAGMVAKDDVLLAKTQVSLMKADLEKAKMDLSKAKIELKKSIGYPLEKDIEIEDVFTTEKYFPNLEEGIKQGLNNRLEIRKAKGEYLVYKLNFDIVKRIYPENTFQYREALLQVNKAWDNYQKAIIDVEGDIRNAYDSLMYAQNMLDYIQNCVKDAQEVLKIAEYKYQKGFPYPTKNLKTMDLEDASGTILEVLAAQERLADVEEKVVEIVHSFNLAKANYDNSIGLPLK